MKKHPFIFTWVAILALLTLSYPSNAQERNKTRVFSRTASQLISPRVTISATPNADGIVFGSLGTATKGIDFTNSNLASTDNYLYMSATQYWNTVELSAPNFVGGNVAMSRDKQIKPSASTGNANIFIAGIQALLIGNSYGDNGSSVGYLTSCTSNGTTLIAKASTWGFTPTVGIMIQIITGSTSADLGTYRLVSFVQDTSFTVDRALAGSDADLNVRFIKDVIGFFATDGTNGQRIAGYSAQDKPLQLGGDVLAATTRSLTGKDVLIGGKLEVDGAAYFDSTIWAGGNINLITGDFHISWGSNYEAKMLFESADPNAHEFILALPDGGAVDVPVFVIGDQGIVNVNLGWFDGITEPSIALVNAAENAYVRYGSTVDVSANSTGAGSILMKGTTARDSTGFLAITVTGTTYYIPFFTTITG